MAYFKVFLTVVLLGLINNAYCKPADDNNNQNEFYNFLMGNTSKESMDACLDEVGMTKDELRENRHKQLISEKCLCLAKCIATSSGRLGEDGTINIAEIKSSFPEKMKDELDTTIACMEKLDKITSCAGMDDVLKCLPKPPKKDN
ncbi:unnamed protein product [Ceutorhynchus assimilis]|uniref:Uncharacterized protein n=1 Tax=Ceutorhynchus assimilis TaxID=467358 RepID=A0A9N9QMV6_9CUCU|nr:unnamed protein product [Ceutorhynchus assimilis]